MSKACIFVVEDDADLREALGDTLGLAGYETVLIGDGRLALDALEQREPDLIITDIQMRRPVRIVREPRLHIRLRQPDGLHIP